MDRALNAMTVEEWEERMTRWGYPAFRGRQIFHYFHKERKLDIQEARVLPAEIRSRLAALPVCRLTVAKELRSRDGSRKLLYRLGDGAVVEAVFMPYTDRNTLCLSSEVGCRMGCTFCASTKAPFQRRMDAAEMLEELYETERYLGVTINNLVLMGIGEPLDNYEEVLRFIRLVTDPRGRDLSIRSITLSTAGLVPQIYQLADEGLSLNLAVSLHASSDEERRKTMPIARRYSIGEILAACHYYFEKTGRRVSFEYVLIQGVNDQPEDLDRLAHLLSGREFHINLLPLNEIEEYQGRSAAFDEIEKFRKGLEDRGVHATIRKRRGGDIDGACGQLRILYDRAEAEA